MPFLSTVMLECRDMGRQSCCDLPCTKAAKSELAITVFNDYYARDPSKLSPDRANVVKRNMNFLEPDMKRDIYAIGYE